MGPIAARWAEAMCARGHQVEVVTAHPHYPGPLWGRRAPPLPGDAKRHPRPSPPACDRPPDHRGEDHGGGDLCGLGGGRRGARLGPGRGRGGLAVVPRPVSGAGERPPSTIPLDPLARGHPARCRRHDRADARGARAPHGPAPGAIRLSLRGPDRRDLERVPREPARQGGAAVEGHPHLQPLHARPRRASHRAERQRSGAHPVHGEHGFLTEPSCAGARVRALAGPRR